MVEAELIRYLETFVTERRKGLFRKVLAERTRYLSVVVEEIYQPHNASAVLRTCECLGIQDVHILEGMNRYQVHPDIALGASKWLTLHKHNLRETSHQVIFSKLKESGYRIVATVPDAKATEIDKFNLEKGKSALLFGSEFTGISEKSLAFADEFITIPMYGFTESYNISVSAALCLYTLVQELRTTKIAWKLTKDEQEWLYLSWLKNSIKSADEIIEYWNHKHHKSS